jgi:DNA primase
VQTRYLEPGDGPKYDNPAASLGANPRLGWTQAIGPAQPSQLIVCEGIPDALTAAGAGYEAVAVLGSQAPDYAVADVVARHADRSRQALIAVTDNDPAGEVFGFRLQALFAGLDRRIEIVTPPRADMDLNEWSMLSEATGVSWIGHRASTISDLRPFAEPVER